MIALLNLLGNVVYSLATLVVGFHLLRLYRRTRQLPELLLGVGLLCGGAIGYSLYWAPLAMGVAPGSPAGLAFFLSHRFFLGARDVAILYFTWQVFRSGQAWARTLTIAGGACVALYVAVPLFVNTFDVQHFLVSPLYWIGTVGHATPYVWSSWEALRYQAALRRRLRLGLPDENPGLATRLALWGAAFGAVALTHVALNGLFAINFFTADPLAWWPLVVSGLGLVSAALLWFAFFPAGAAGRAAAAAD